MNEARDRRRDRATNMRAEHKRYKKLLRLKGASIYSHNCKCFWTRPFGHVRFWSRRRFAHTRCVVCGEL